METNEIPAIGDYNTAIGYESGSNLDGGAFNTLLGFKAKPDAAADSNCVRIGAYGIIKYFVGRIEHSLYVISLGGKREAQISLEMEEPELVAKAENQTDEGERFHGSRSPAWPRRPEDHWMRSISKSRSSGALSSVSRAAAGSWVTFRVMPKAAMFSMIGSSRARRSGSVMSRGSTWPFPRTA